MSPTNRTATSTGQERPTVRTSSRSGLADSALGTLIGGAFVEVPLALMLYRKWTWWSFLISATTFGLLNGIMYVSVMSASAGIASASAGVIIAVVSALVGGAITLVLTRLLNRAGVGIDHRATGRA